MPTSSAGSQEVIYERDLRNLRVSRSPPSKQWCSNKLRLVPSYESRLLSCLVPYQHGGSSACSCSRSCPYSRCYDFLTSAWTGGNYEPRVLRNSALLRRHPVGP